MHKPWCVRIWQTTSAKCMHHQPRYARISRGVCASARRHRPWLARIGQGLHASTVVCAHLANDVSQQHAACMHVSAVACAHRLGDIGHDLRASSYGRRNRPRLARTNRDIYTSAGGHRLLPAHIGQATSAQRHASSAKTCTHLTWHVYIGQATSANDMRYRSGDIGRGLPASAMTCADRSGDVGR